MNETWHREFACSVRNEVGMVIWVSFSSATPVILSSSRRESCSKPRSILGLFSWWLPVKVKVTSVTGRCGMLFAKERYSSERWCKCGKCWASCEKNIGSRILPLMVSDRRLRKWGRSLGQIWMASAVKLCKPETKYLFKKKISLPHTEFLPVHHEGRIVLTAHSVMSVWRFGNLAIAGKVGESWERFCEEGYF